MEGKAEYLVEEFLADLKFNIVVGEVLSRAVGPNSNSFVQTRRYYDLSFYTRCQACDTITVERTGEVRHFAELLSFFRTVLHLQNLVVLGGVENVVPSNICTCDDVIRSDSIVLHVLLAPKLFFVYSSRHFFLQDVRAIFFHTGLVNFKLSTFIDEDKAIRLARNYVLYLKGWTGRAREHHFVVPTHFSKQNIAFNC